MSPVQNALGYTQSLFSLKTLIRNPNVYASQLKRPHRSFRDLVVALAAKQSPISIVQVGANDGLRGDPIGNWMLQHRDRVNALLIEPQRAAYERLAARYADAPNVTCLQAAVDTAPGERIIYSVKDEDMIRKIRTDNRIGSFDHDTVFRFLKRRALRAKVPLDEEQVKALITAETVPALPLRQALHENGIAHPDVILIDVEGFDGEVVRMILDDNLLPGVLQYEHSKLSRTDRRHLTARLTCEGYRLWADRSDTWGRRHAS